MNYLMGKQVVMQLEKNLGKMMQMSSSKQLAST